MGTPGQGHAMGADRARQGQSIAGRGAGTPCGYGRTMARVGIWARGSTRQHRARAGAGIGASYRLWHRAGHRARYQGRAGHGQSTPRGTL